MLGDKLAAEVNITKLSNCINDILAYSALIERSKKGDLTEVDAIDLRTLRRSHIKFYRRGLIGYLSLGSNHPIYILYPNQKAVVKAFRNIEVYVRENNQAAVTSTSPIP